ncbi:MAG: TnsA endonuclease N-terminal domain-containing protein [Atribacterota bacterium]
MERLLLKDLAGGSGWYNGWYFRSLRELSYVINVLEYYNKKWQSAEKDIIIEYIDYNGQKRTYRADFLVENKELIEVKPKKLMESPSNILKKRAAEEYCKNNNLIYKMVDVKILSKEELLELYNNKKIKFIKKWDLIFREKYLKT